MKPFFYSLLTVFLVVISVHRSTAQSFKLQFAITNQQDITHGRMFTVSIKKKDSSLVYVIQTEQIADTGIHVKDTTATSDINNLSKNIFKVTVAVQLKKIDAAFTDSNREEIDTVLDNVYQVYANQQVKAQQQHDTATLQYGINEYYGLTPVEKDSLLSNFQRYKQLQQQKHLIKLQAPHNCFWLLGIKFGGSNDAYKHYMDSTHYQHYNNSLKIVRRQIRDLNSGRQYQASLVGSANVVTSFKIAQQSQINGGFGILVSKPNNTEFTGIFTISQSNDTIIADQSSGDFGGSILVPGVRKFSLLTSYRCRQLWPYAYSNFWRRIGIAWNVNITPYNWAIKTADNANDSIMAKVIPLSMDLMLPFNWVNIYQDGTDVCISTDVGITGRYIMGNADGPTRKAFLGNSSSCYFGVIAGINIKYNGLRFQFHVPALFGHNVTGLTGGQAYASMSFVANIIGPKSIQSLFSK